jgi:hypothetical protein
VATRFRASRRRASSRWLDRVIPLNDASNRRKRVGRSIRATVFRGESGIMATRDEIIARHYSAAILMFVRSGMSQKAATEAAKSMIDGAYQKVFQRGSDPFVEGDDGDRALAREASDPALQSEFNRRRAEGVTDDDIRWWHNMSAFEREMLLATDHTNWVGMYMTLKDRGCTPAQAAHEINQLHPQFGGLTEMDTSDDRRLPIELKRRILKYIEHNGATLQTATERESSFNALVRKEIRAGRL